MNRGIMGFVGQGMNGRKAHEPQIEPYVFPPGSHTFRPPVVGRWKFIGWAPGGSGGVGTAGASGGYFEITQHLTTGHTAEITVGRVGVSDTSITFPNFAAHSATATRANGATPGTASGRAATTTQLVTLDGTTGTGSTPADGAAGLGTGGGQGGTQNGGLDGGAGAPGILPYRGGRGGNAAGLASNEGGPGAGGGETSVGSALGGCGLVIAVLLKQG